jgi:hypothetical protein
MVATDRWKPTYIDSITLTTDLRFSTTGLTKQLNEMVSISDSDGYLIDYSRYDDTKYSCTSQTTADALSVEYNYIPSALSSATDVTVFPNAAIDETGLCFYGAYMYLFVEEEFSKAEKWKNLYEQWLYKVPNNKGDSESITDVMW